MTLRADDARPDAAAEALTDIESELRDLIRTRGIDPAKDAASARLLVQEVLDSYAGRTLGGVLPPLADQAQTARALYDRVAGAGPLQRYLDDPEIEEIWIK